MMVSANMLEVWLCRSMSCSEGWFQKGIIGSFANDQIFLHLPPINQECIRVRVHFLVIFQAFQTKSWLVYWVWLSMLDQYEQRWFWMGMQYFCCRKRQWCHPYSNKTFQTLLLMMWCWCCNYKYATIKLRNSKSCGTHVTTFVIKHEQQSCTTRSDMRAHKGSVEIGWYPKFIQKMSVVF